MSLREYVSDARDLARALAQLSLREQEIPVHSHGPNVHIIGGFVPYIGNYGEWLFHNRYYRVLRNVLVQWGARAHISQVGVSYRNFYETIELLHKERIELFGDEPVSCIGHSLGGVLGIGALFIHPNSVDRVIGLASPTRNPPDPTFAEKVFTCTGISEELFFKHEEEVLLRSEHITLISSPTDPIAPSCNCIIETKDGRRGKAVHINIPEQFSGYDVTHYNMPFDIRILSLVAELITRSCEEK